MKPFKNASHTSSVLSNVSADYGDDDSVASGLARETKCGKLQARVGILFFIFFCSICCYEMLSVT